MFLGHHWVRRLVRQPACVFLIVVSFCASCRSHDKHTRAVDDNRVWVHQRRLAFLIMDIVRNEPIGKEDFIKTIQMRIAREYGEEAIWCPICRKRLRINSGVEKWQRPDDHLEDTAVHCDDPIHGRLLGFRFDGTTFESLVGE